MGERSDGPTQSFFALSFFFLLCRLIHTSDESVTQLLVQ